MYIYICIYIYSSSLFLQWVRVGVWCLVFGLTGVWCLVFGVWCLVFVVFGLWFGGSCFGFHVLGLRFGVEIGVCVTCCANSFPTGEHYRCKS
jgi:hypothetical protein